MTYISGSENEARLSDQTYWRDEAESGSLEWSALDPQAAWKRRRLRSTTEPFRVGRAVIMERCGDRDQTGWWVKPTLPL